jgi:hypothetical protein
LYRLYTAAYVVPGSLFQVPVAQMALITAKLVTGKDLPPHIAELVTCFGVFFTVSTIMKIRFASHKWQNLIPSGTAFAIGMTFP